MPVLRQYGSRSRGSPAGRPDSHGTACGGPGLPHVPHSAAPREAAGGRGAAPCSREACARVLPRRRVCRPGAAGSEARRAAPYHVRRTGPGHECARMPARPGRLVIAAEAGRGRDTMSRMSPHRPPERGAGAAPGGGRHGQGPWRRAGARGSRGHRHQGSHARKAVRAWVQDARQAREADAGGVPAGDCAGSILPEGQGRDRIPGDQGESGSGAVSRGSQMRGTEQAYRVLAYNCHRVCDL